ncbi:MAG: hypothetical protein QM286_06780 [Acidobacteriota bacterium]|jgi:hypothetical protein|nr:hypothetical protein [Acidobacteriota bacterium]
MSSALRKVRSGDPLVIPAAAYNAFIDAALDFRQRTAHLGQGAQPSFSQASIVLVRNDSGSNQNRMAVLGVEAPIIDPSANEEEFRNRVALSCVAPEEGTHEGRFVVLAEPIANGKIGRAYAAGVCPVKIDVPDEENECRYAEIADGVTANLKVSLQGSATILWRAGGTGVQWAVIRLGQPVPMHAFPVELTKVGGEQGDEENPATWTYDVLDVVTGETLASGVDPVASPHKWQRPSVGQMIAATFGYAHYQPNDAGEMELVLSWINEMVDQEACPDSGGG